MSLSRQTIPTLQKPTSEARKQYNMETRIYYKAGQALRDKGTFAFMATNIGDKIAVVNGITLYPGTPGSLLGDSRTVGIAFEGYEYVGNIDIKFTGAGTAPALELVTLFYPSDPQ
jgi:hypothetical protein